MAVECSNDSYNHCSILVDWSYCRHDHCTHCWIFDDGRSNVSNYYTKLVKSLREEAASAKLIAESSTHTPGWREGMGLLGKKMDAAANAIEDLMDEVEKAANHGNS